MLWGVIMEKMLEMSKMLNMRNKMDKVRDYRNIKIKFFCKKNKLTDWNNSEHKHSRESSDMYSKFNNTKPNWNKYQKEWQSNIDKSWGYKIIPPKQTKSTFIIFSITCSNNCCVVQWACVKFSANSIYNTTKFHKNVIIIKYQSVR